MKYSFCSAAAICLALASPLVAADTYADDDSTASTSTTVDTTLGIGGLKAGVSLGASADMKLGRDEAEFFRKAAIAGMAEVEAARIARDKAVDADTRAFAEMMLTDHGKHNAELKALASAKGVSLPTVLDAKHQDLIEELQDKKSGKDFDDKYSDDMEEAHEDAVNLFEKAARSNDAEVRAFAQASLPKLKAHLEMARKLDAAK